MVLISIILHEHQADNHRMWPIGEVIHRTALEKKIPLTFSMSGITLEAMARCCPDIVSSMRHDFANKLTPWDAHKPELIISTYNNMPIILPWLPSQYLGTFLSEFTLPQIIKSKLVSEHCFHRTPRGFFPPEIIFSPATSHTLEQSGLNYALISGEHFGHNNFAKGQVYYVGDQYKLGLKLVVRINDLNIFERRKNDAYALKDEIKTYAKNNNIGRIVIGCDLGHFTGLYAQEQRDGLTLHDGIARLCNLADAIHSDSETNLVNCAAIADSYWHPQNIYTLYQSINIADPHHFISTWMNCSGNLDSLIPPKVHNANNFVKYYVDYLQGGHDKNDLNQKKEQWFWQSGAENLMWW